MVNAGRVACIFTPFVLSAAALVCLIFIFLAGTQERNTTLGSLYYFKADLSNLTTGSSTLANLLGDVSSTNYTAIESALQAAKQSLGLKDYYTVYLWNYCAWNGNDLYAYCSPKQAKFAFDPIQVWGLNSTLVEPLLPASFINGVNEYKTASGWLYILYLIALVFTITVLLVGITAMFSRWGSFFTTLAAWVSTIFLIGASSLATAVYVTLLGVLDSELKPYGVKGSLGLPFLRTTWLGVAFSLGAGFFWLLSVCCCSARSPYKGRQDGNNRRVKVEKTPYTYERVGSPYLGPTGDQNVPLNHLELSHGPQQGYAQKNTAYEPFRPTQV